MVFEACCRWRIVGRAVLPRRRATFAKCDLCRIDFGARRRQSGVVISPQCQPDRAACLHQRHNELLANIVVVRGVGTAPQPPAHNEITSVGRRRIWGCARRQPFFAVAPFLPSSLCAADDLRGFASPSFAALAFAFFAVSLPLPFFSAMSVPFVRRTMNILTTAIVPPALAPASCILTLCA